MELSTCYQNCLGAASSYGLDESGPNEQAMRNMTETIGMVPDFGMNFMVKIPVCENFLYIYELVYYSYFTT